MKKQYGILAYPAKHSLSPVIHNACFKDLGMDAEYGIFEVEEKNLDDFMMEARKNNIAGLSVSLPYKEVVLKYMDKIDEDAEKIGAVNTIVKRDGLFYGYNTDYLGAIAALKESYGDLKSAICVVVGAGGAGRAVAYGLLKEGADVWIKNRTKEKADKVAIEFAELFDSEIHSDDWDNWETGDIFVNATSIWREKIDWRNIPTFCDLPYLKDFKIAMDVSYYKKETPLFASAQETGVIYVCGERMLLHQAVWQFKLWTGKTPPFDVMENALYDSIWRD